MMELGSEPPPDAPHLPRPLLAARALTQITGERVEPIAPAAWYALSVGDVEGRLHIAEPTLDEEVVRVLLAERFERELLPADYGTAVEAVLYPGGNVSLSIVGAWPWMAPALPQEELARKAAADLRGGAAAR